MNERTTGFTPEVVEHFTAYHYRTSSRFGGPVDIAISDDWVTVSGRRVSRRSRDVWLWVQGILMLKVVFTAAYALPSGSRRAWKRVGLWALIEYLVAAFGALFVWWPADRGEDGAVWQVCSGQLRDDGERKARAMCSAVGFPRTHVRNARVTRWYSRHGLWLVSWPWQLLNYLLPTSRHDVVFDVDDPARPGSTLVFAVNAGSRESAKALAEALNRPIR